jgi:SsrA-binding protein
VGEKPAELRRIAENRRARFEYEVLEELECGIVLQGTEVKSLRAGKASIQEAYAMIKGGELWLLKCTIPEYAQGNVHNHVPTRERKLLASKREIASWHAKVKEKGVTIVPLGLYFRGSRVKVQLGLCRGKKLHDKREVVRERQDRRDMARATRRR